MVRDFYSKQGKSEQLIAQLTGVLAATQSLGRAIASFPWGLISDVIGRKVKRTPICEVSARKYNCVGKACLVVLGTFNIVSA